MTWAEAQKGISDKNAEIERLKELVRYHCEQQMLGWKTERALKALITELADAILRLTHDRSEATYQLYLPLLQRAREATK